MMFTFLMRMCNSKSSVTDHPGSFKRFYVLICPQAPGFSPKIFAVTIARAYFDFFFFFFFFFFFCTYTIDWCLQRHT